MRLLALAVLCTFGCGDEWSSASNVCHARSDAAADDPARMLATLLDERGSAEALAELLTTEAPDEDGVLVALFPATAGRTLVDRELAPPAPYTGTINEAFAPTPIAFPIDWSANPLSDVSWQLWFQSLYWLDRADIDTAAFTVVDFAENALYQPSLEFLWGDHALALRLRAVTGFVARYVERGGELDRKVLHAAAVVIVSQLLAMGSDGCYTEGQNHGLMEDIAVLAVAPRYPALRDGERLWNLALERARRQVAVSVLPDGIHIENSPAYQLHFTGLVVQVLDAMVSGGRPADVELQAVTARLIGGLAAMVQPNLTLAQFGDTANTDMQAALTNLVRAARDVGVDAKQVDELEWIASRGELGLAPDQIDTVFTEGGFAVFRSGWSVTNAAATVTAHFRARHASYSHYQPDDTGIEIYGYGSELVLGPGVHGYDPADPFVAYQYSPAAHNVLVVDGLTEVDHGADAASRMIASYAGEDLAWAQGTHRNYRALGIESLVRTFAYDKVASFAVIDHVRADGKSHRYEQHFHLHPRLSDVSRSGTSVIARTVDGTGPTVTFTPATPAAIRTERGVNDDGHVAGWHFPDKYQEEAATDVVVDRVDDGVELDVPTLILVAEPGRPAALPTDVSYEHAGGQGVLRWTIDGKARSLSAPLPDPDEAARDLAR